jgi:hypothetical protein
MLLNGLLEDAPADQVTLDWLMSRLGDRSFGIIICLLSLLALVPGVSGVIGLLIAVPALQMILARPGPAFPKRIASHGFPTHQLGRVIRKITPILRYLEKFIHPRWTTPFETTKRVVGTVVLLLGGLLLVPLPLSNVPPALIIMLISVAYLEQDGVLLCAGMTVAVLLLAVVLVGLWETMSTAGWVKGIL